MSSNGKEHKVGLVEGYRVRQYESAMAVVGEPARIHTNSMAEHYLLNGVVNRFGVTVKNIIEDALNRKTRVAKGAVIHWGDDNQGPHIDQAFEQLDEAMRQSSRRFVPSEKSVIRELEGLYQLAKNHNDKPNPVLLNYIYSNLKEMYLPLFGGTKIYSYRGDVIDRDMGILEEAVKGAIFYDDLKPLIDDHKAERLRIQSEQEELFAVDPEGTLEGSDIKGKQNPDKFKWRRHSLEDLTPEALESQADTSEFGFARDPYSPQAEQRVSVPNGSSIAKESSLVSIKAPRANETAFGR